MTIYFIPGLGADWRTFKKLNLNKGLILRYIEWIEPVENESVNKYAQRLTEQINTNEPFSLVGLSFGGIIAYEMAKIIDPDHTVIISSFKPGKRPGIIKFIRFTKLYYLIPYNLVSSPNKVTYKIFGARSDEDKALLDEIMKDSDVEFFKWALKSMMKYKSDTGDIDTIHIHGTGDRIIPIRHVSPDITIEKGTHFMVYNMAEIISNELNLIFGKD